MRDKVLPVLDHRLSVAPMLDWTDYPATARRAGKVVQRWYN